MGLRPQQQTVLRRSILLRKKQFFCGITKLAETLAGREHGTTLRADCIHRCVLRCGRSHSGEEQIQTTIVTVQEQTRNVRAGSVSDSSRKSSELALLGEDFPAECNAAVEQYHRKVGASGALLLRPEVHRRQ